MERCVGRLEARLKRCVERLQAPVNGCRTRCALAYWETITNGAAEALPDTLRAGVLGNNHKRLCETLPATLPSVPDALRSALDVLRTAPESAAGSGDLLREFSG